MICRSDSQLLSGIGEMAVWPGGQGQAPPLDQRTEVTALQVRGDPSRGCASLRMTAALAAPTGEGGRVEPSPPLSPGERELKGRGAPGAMGFFGPAAAGPQNDSVSWMLSTEAGAGAGAQPHEEIDKWLFSGHSP